MFKYFELRIMLTQQENLYYQVNSGRPIAFVNKLAATGLGNKHDSDVREYNGKWALPTVVNR